MKPYGIGTVNLMEMNGDFEVPLTLPQDQQMLHVVGMTVKQTLEVWLKLMGVIKDIKGVCSILIHPDYKFADFKVYEEFLNDITACNRAWITIPRELIDT